MDLVRGKAPETKGNRAAQANRSCTCAMDDGPDFGLRPLSDRQSRGSGCHTVSEGRIRDFLPFMICIKPFFPRPPYTVVELIWPPPNGIIKT
jgi:hypothetical protein